MDEFIEKIVIGRTIQAAFQRGKVYKPNLKKQHKEEVKESIRGELRRLAQIYNGNITEEDHIRNIKNLSRKISRIHRDKLRNGRLRIGTSQKLLNVYLKFLWCLDTVEEPSHCPIDGIVLREIKNKKKWTDIKSLRKYRTIINEIRRHIMENDTTVARWEWELWNRMA